MARLPSNTISVLSKATHSPAANTAAVLTLAAPGAGFGHVLDAVSWSYSAATAAAATLTISSGGTVIWTENIPASAAAAANVAGKLTWPNGLECGDNEQVVITLGAGGAAVLGSANAVYR